MNADVRRMMQSFFTETSESYAEACWRPSADVYRGCNGWLVKFDLAGVHADEIRLLAKGHRLTVQGTRRDLSILEQQQAYSMEISYNRFERSIELPCDVENAQIHSEYRDGMFLVLITPCQP